MNYFIQAITKNYVNFNGRARRAEYCYFVLFYFIINLVFMMMVWVSSLWIGTSHGDYSYFGFAAFLNTIFCLATLLPTITIMVRRFHDTGNSGLWTLLLLAGAIPAIGGIVVLGLILYLMIAPGTQGKNQYGENPIETENKEVQTKNA